MSLQSGASLPEFLQTIRGFQEAYSKYLHHNQQKAKSTVEMLLRLNDINVFASVNRLYLPPDWGAVYFPFLPESVTGNQRAFNTMILRASVVSCLVTTFGNDAVVDLFSQQDVVSNFYLTHSSMAGRIGRSRGGLLEKIFYCLSTDTAQEVLARHGVSSKKLSEVLQDMKARFPVQRLIRSQAKGLLMQHLLIGRVHACTHS